MIEYLRADLACNLSTEGSVDDGVVQTRIESVWIVGGVRACLVQACKFVIGEAQSHRAQVVVELALEESTQRPGSPRAPMYSSSLRTSRAATPRHPSDLHTHGCIVFRRVPSGTLYKWEFEENGREFEVAPVPALIVNDSAMMVRTAQSGIDSRRC